MPLTLTITADSAELLLKDVMSLATAPMALSNMVAKIRQSQQPQTVAGETAQSTNAEPTVETMPTAEPVADKDVPKRRKNKAQPTLEGVAQAQSETAAEVKAAEQPPTDPLEIPDFLKKDKAVVTGGGSVVDELKGADALPYDIPQTQEEARKLCGKVIDECGASVMEAIIRGKMKLNKFNDIGVERYGELAGLCHEALGK